MTEAERHALEDARVACLAAAAAIEASLRSSPTGAACSPVDGFVSTGVLAKVLGISKAAALQRARRGASAGISRKVGGRWLVHLGSMV